MSESMADNLTPSSSHSTADRTPIRSGPHSTVVETGPSRPAIRLSTSPSASKLTGRTHESRKLLAHILGQLERRPKPPPFFEAFSNVDVVSKEKTLGVFVETVKGTMHLGGKRRDVAPSLHVESTDDDTDDELDRVFSTDTTYDLMVQLKNVLIMSVTQGWHIFDDGYD
jgi:hypothetical protein